MSLIVVIHKPPNLNDVINTSLFFAYIKFNQMFLIDGRLIQAELFSIMWFLLSCGFTSSIMWFLLFCDFQSHPVRRKQEGLQIGRFLGAKCENVSGHSHQYSTDQDLYGHTELQQGQLENVMQLCVQEEEETGLVINQQPLTNVILPDLHFFSLLD